MTTPDYKVDLAAAGWVKPDTCRDIGELLKNVREVHLGAGTYDLSDVDIPSDRTVVVHSGAILHTAPGHYCFKVLGTSDSRKANVKLVMHDGAVADAQGATTGGLFYAEYVDGVTVEGGEWRNGHSMVAVRFCTQVRVRYGRYVDSVGYYSGMVSAQESQDVVVEDCYFRNACSDFITFYDPEGSSSPSYSVVARNNYLTGTFANYDGPESNGRGGIHFYRVNGCQAIGNRFDAHCAEYSGVTGTTPWTSEGAQIRVRSSAEFNVSDNECRGQGYGNYVDVLYTSSAGDCGKGIVSNNRFYGGQADMTYAVTVYPDHKTGDSARAYPVIVSGNYCEDVPKGPFSVRSSYSEVTGNLVYNPTAVGINSQAFVYGEGTHIAVRDNTFYQANAGSGAGSGTYGVYLTGTAAHVSGNTLTFDAYGKTALYTAGYRSIVSGNNVYLGSAAGHGIDLRGNRSVACGNAVEMPAGADDYDGVYVNASACIVSDSTFVGGRHYVHIGSAGSALVSDCLGTGRSGSDNVIATGARIAGGI